MKIRTDFVTNSSSESWGEIIIDNPVLLEILTRYKEKGTFGDPEGGIGFMIGSFYEYDFQGDLVVPDQDIKTLTPAFHSFLPSLENTPSFLEELLEKIVEVIDNLIYDDYDEKYNRDFYQQMVEEIYQKDQEIFDAFITVKWFSRQELYSGRFGCWEFTFDQENGEFYHEEVTGSLDF